MNAIPARLLTASYLQHARGVRIRDERVPRNKVRVLIRKPSARRALF